MKRFKYAAFLMWLRFHRNRNRRKHTPTKWLSLHMWLFNRERKVRE